MSITINEQGQKIRNSLQAYAQDNGGYCTVVSDLAHLWKMAYIASDKLRILVCYMGEDARGPFSLAASTYRVDRQWTVMVTRGRGFSAERGDYLTDTVQNAKPLFDLVDDVRNLIRCILNASVELPVDFKKIRTFTTGKLITDAYLIEFSLAADLPKVVATPPNPVFPPGPPITA